MGLEQHIDSASDDKLLQLVMEEIYTCLDERWESEYKIISALPLPIRAVYTVCAVGEEVCNGGWVQYFYNTRGIFTNYIYDDLLRIGAYGHAELCKRVVEQYAKEESLYSYAISDLECNEAFDYLYAHSSLSSLEQPGFDTEFFALQDNDPYWAIEARYIRSNRSIFVSYFANT